MLSDTGYKEKFLMGKFTKHPKVKITLVKDVGGQLLVNYDFQSFDIMDGSVRDDRYIRIGSLCGMELCPKVSCFIQRDNRRIYDECFRKFAVTLGLVD